MLGFQNYLKGMLERRARILAYYFGYSRRFRSVKFSEILHYMISPLLFPLFVHRMITRKIQTGKFTKIYIKGFDLPLYWPNDCKISDAYHVLYELFGKHSWHRYEIPETTICKGDVLVDVGAAEGLFSLKHVKKCKSIYAIEPLPVFTRSLAMTFQQSPNVVIFPCAVGNETKDVFISNNSKFSKISEIDGIKIKIDTLDRLLNGIHIDYLKTDIEGYEYEMLLGAKNLIKQCKPRMAITIYHPGQDGWSIIKLVKEIEPSYKYKVKGIDFAEGKPMMVHFWI
jgi:FkbM family methyltransferase